MIPLYKPFMPELPELEKILNSGALAYGKQGRSFEKKLQDFFSCQNTLVTNTFNTAIDVMLTSFDIKYNDEIILSPMACLASTQPYLSYGLKLVWADIDPNTGTLDPDSVRKKITSNTKMIVHNHFCGYVGYVDEINAIGKENGIIIVDDGIECFGSRYKGLKIGNTGADATVFSFNPVRIPNTIDGGAIVFNSKENYEKSLLIRDCGINRSLFRDENGEIDPLCDIELLGYSATISDVNAYIGCMQMEYVDPILSAQRKIADKWVDIICGIDNIKPLSTKNTDPNYWVFGCLAQDKLSAIKFFREKGYYASGVHINNNRYSVFGDYKHLKGVEDFYSKFFALPSGWWVEDINIENYV